MVLLDADIKSIKNTFHFYVWGLLAMFSFSDFHYFKKYIPEHQNVKMKEVDVENVVEEKSIMELTANSNNSPIKQKILNIFYIMI
jgi:hypothetical protein